MPQITTVGTQRQYTGTAGRTENAQVAVYLAYAAPARSAFTDRALYLPRSWTSDPGRRTSAGIPEGTVSATKPALARQMTGRALDAGTPAGWAAADEVYGQDPQLRAELSRRGLGYVLAVAKSHPVITGIGPRPPGELARRLPARAWQRLSAGPGAKGPRSRPGVIAPASARGRVAMEGRSWTSWHRWTILALLAYAFLPVLAAAQPRGGDPHDDLLIPLTRNEICKLLTGLSRKLATPAMQLHWSRWRRRHQATARACHYRRRAPAPP